MPSNDPSPLKTTIALPRHSAWTSGLHFHASHTEYLRLVKGAIFVKLNGTTKLISALAGGEIDKVNGQLVQEGLVVEVPRFVRHNWGRLEHYRKSTRAFGRGVQQHRNSPEDWTEEVVVEEWTDPSDIKKPLFFWNLNAIITAPGEASSKRERLAKDILGEFWIDLQLFIVFWELDNWPVFFDLRNLSYGYDQGVLPRLTDGAEIIVSFIVLFIARIVGFLLGLHAVEQRRTPDALWEAYRKPAHTL
ncbi:hypothetical protein C7974DRAFT_433150 [Boeremia exigua]|uniref:uncharacterized protein n=1 Tax=Boeremia exigua TaxID=749465 RepID=UPI001E8E7E04|nr:uncharacterized protein C7974DRAFT_433150 [Boeremia exigua]KAH6632958.1 hypothetical protein C7974DRAFT_433150 [Boeremia exigua]